MLRVWLGGDLRGLCVGVCFMCELVVFVLSECCDCVFFVIIEDVFTCVGCCVVVFAQFFS